MAQRILALEMVGEEVRAGLAERAWSRFTFLGSYTSPQEEGEADLLPAIERLLAQTGTPDIVIAAFPAELVAKRVLTLPFHDARRLRQAVPFALEEHLPFGVEEGVIAYVPLLRRDNDSVVLAAMVRKADLRAYLDFLARANLDPKTVTLSGLALSLLPRQTRSGDGTAAHLLLNLNQSQTAIALTDESGVPRAMRVASISTDDGRNGWCDAVVTLARQTLLAGSGQAAPADLIVAGTAALSEEVRDYLADQLALPVRGIDEIETKFLHHDNPEEMISRASCCAMLLGELPAQPLPLINLRQSEFSFHGRTGDLAPLYTSAWLAVVLLVMLIVDFSAGLATGYHQLWLLNRHIVTTAAPVLPGVPADRLARTLAGQMAQANRRLRLLGGSGSVGSPLDTLLVLSRALPSRLALDIDELTIDDTGLRITGRANSYATIDTVKRALSQAEGLADVQVTDEKPGPDHKVEFHLTAAIRDTFGETD